MKIRLLYILFIAHLCACGFDPNNEAVFDEFDKALSHSEKEELLHSFNWESLLSAAQNIDTESAQKLLDSLDFIASEDSSSLVGYSRSTMICLASYSSHLKGAKISYESLSDSLDIILNDTETAQRIVSDYWRKLRCDFSNINYTEIKISDTVCLSFPCRKSKHGWDLDYRLPDVDVDEIVHLKCVLLEKKPIYDRVSDCEYLFELEVQEITRDSCFFMSKSISSGALFKFYISHYGRKIERVDCL